MNECGAWLTLDSSVALACGLSADHDGPHFDPEFHIWWELEEEEEL